MSDQPHEPRMSPAGEKPEPGPKRIYKTAAHVPSDDGHAIQLDGRAVRTPARHVLAVPSPAMADAIVAEWMTQGEHVDHQSMPITRFANTAIDNVRGREAVICDEIASFASNDLLCYRAETPQGLVAMQMASWDPVIAWAEGHYDVRFTLVAGVIHVPQPEKTQSALRTALNAYDPFALTALHNMTTLTGSALLALAIANGDLSADAAWRAAHIDEDWQISQWGEDAEATARRAYRGGEFLSAFQFLTLHNAS